MTFTINAMIIYLALICTEPLSLLQHWDLNEMGYVETMFGHQAEINAIDSWRKERAVTGGRDRTVRPCTTQIHGYCGAPLDFTTLSSVWTQYFW